MTRLNPAIPQTFSADAPNMDSGDDRLAFVVDMVREISLQTDPQSMIAIFRKRAYKLHGVDQSVSLSRRDLQFPQYRITRSTRWKEDINPWTQKERLPLLKGGLLAELVYDDQPRVIRDFRPIQNDPAFEYLQDARALISLPLYEGGVPLNMVVRMASEPDAMDAVRVPEALLEANLFGRATSHLLTAGRLQRAYAELDHEMKRVADIQRSLLPQRLPKVPTLDIAASYKTAARAGGDYYDFFDIGDGRWGVLIADVSGHGTPAAVVMAMLRTMLHAQCQSQGTPSAVLCCANAHLCDRSDRYSGVFVTAFYGIYDPSDRSLQYACAGHNPPLLVDRHRRIRELNAAQSVPLAVDVQCRFPEHCARLAPGDTLLLYTDGITEAVNPRGEMYGLERLLSCVKEDVPNAQHIIDCVTHKLIGFTGDIPQRDDQTLLALKVL